MLSKQVVRFSKIKYILRRFPVLIDRVRNLLGKKSELDLYFKLINKEDIILDIGANTGQLTLPISHYLSNHGEIHSFEPVRMSFDELKRKITYEKPRSNVFLNNFAISDVDKNSIINYPISDLTQASLNKHDKHSWAKKNEIKSQRISLKKLDTYILENKLKRIDFIKCDVEGAELNVLKGASNLFKSRELPIIKLEIYSEWTKSYGYEPRDIIRYLEDIANYRAFYISKQGIVEVKSSDQVIPGVFWNWLDYIFVPPNKIDFIKFKLKI